MNPPLRFLWKHLKALYAKFVDRVRHCAGNLDFHSRVEELAEGEEDFWMLVFMDELFD